MNPLQRYASILAGNTRPQGLGYGGAEKALGNLATGSAVATTAMYPVVKNNLQYADTYGDVARATTNLGKGVNAYANYKSALGLTDPSSGGINMANMLSPGNLAGSGANLAMMSNPVTGSIAGLNMLTADEENPYGTIPGIKQLNKGITTVSNRLNQTPFARALGGTVRGLYDNTLGRVLNTRPGRFAHSVLSTPFSAVEGTFGAVREGYQALDRGLFGGLLPGGAKDGIEETQRWDNPYTGLKDNFKNVRSTFNDMFTPETTDIGRVENTTPNYDGMTQDKGEFDYMGNRYASAGGETTEDTYSPVEVARNVQKVDATDLDGLNSLLDDVLTIAEDKGIADSTRSIFPSDAKFLTGSYSRSGGDLAMVDTGSGPVPVIQTPEFKKWIDKKASDLGPQGFMSYYKELTGGQDRGGLYTTPAVFEKFIGFDPVKPSKTIDKTGKVMSEWRGAGAKFEALANAFQQDVTGRSSGNVNQVVMDRSGVGPGANRIDMNPVEGIQRVVGEQGVRVGPDTGIGSYRIFI